MPASQISARGPATIAAVVAAFASAQVAGQLTKRIPNSDGGLYASARHEFGDFAGYLTGWC